MSALIGGRASRIFTLPAGPECLAAQAVAEEVAEQPTAPMLTGRGLDGALLLAALSVMPVEWQAPAVYEPHREEADRRMAGRDPEDWPTVALAPARSLPIW